MPFTLKKKPSLEVLGLIRNAEYGQFIPVCHSEGIFFGGKIKLDECFEIIQAPAKNEFPRLVEAQLKRRPSVVYANEAELEAKGFEVVRR